MRTPSRDVAAVMNAGLPITTQARSDDQATRSMRRGERAAARKRDTARMSGHGHELRLTQLERDGPRLVREERGVPLQIERPAVARVDAFAESLPAVEVPVEVAVLELHAGAIGPF